MTIQEKGSNCFDRYLYSWGTYAPEYKVLFLLCVKNALINIETCRLALYVIPDACLDA